MELQEKINNFNETYGLNFSLESFQNALSQEREKANSAGMELSDFVIVDNVFRNTLISSYRQYVKNAYLVEGVYDYASMNLLEDLKDIMEDYQKTDEGNIALGKNVHFELGPYEANEVVYKGLKDFKKNPALGYSELYKEGNFPIRYMREVMDRAFQFDMPTKEELAKGLQFSKALKEVNDSRSFWWKVFHPIRNHAEKRDARMFQEKVEKYIAKTLEGGSALLDDDSVEYGGADIDENTLEWCKNYNPVARDLRKVEEVLTSLGDGLPDEVEAQDAKEEIAPNELIEEKESIIVDLNENEVQNTSRFIETGGESKALDLDESMKSV